MGVELTVPEPVPVRVIVNVYCGGGVRAKVAVQVELAAMTRVVLVAVPVQLPDQPVNVEPAAAAAVSVTDEFCA